MLKVLSGTSMLFSSPKLILLEMLMILSSFLILNQQQLKTNNISKLSKILMKKEDSEVEAMIMNGNLRKPTKIS